jgi:hypothetical protein
MLSRRERSAGAELGTFRTCCGSRCAGHTAAGTCVVHNAYDPATMAAVLSLAVDQDDADVEPGKRGNQRDTLAQ